MAASTISENLPTAERKSPKPQAVTEAVTKAAPSSAATCAAAATSENNAPAATWPGWPMRKPLSTHTATAAKARKIGADRSTGVSSTRGPGRQLV